MTQRRSYQIGTGLFILLGFAALAYLATQTTSVANFRQGDELHAESALHQHRPAQAARAGEDRRRAHRLGAIDRSRSDQARCAGAAFGRQALRRAAGRFRRRDIHQWFIGRPVRFDPARRLAGSVQGRRRVRADAIVDAARRPDRQVPRQRRSDQAGRRKAATIRDKAAEPSRPQPKPADDTRH